MRRRVGLAKRLTAAAATVASVTWAGKLAGVNELTIGFAFLIAVLLLSLWGGGRAGAAASLIATACFNFFFIPPFYTFTIADPANWVALGTFLVTAVITSRLVTAARVQATTAEARRTELEALYGLSIDLFTATNRTGALGEAAGRALSMLGAGAGGLVLFDGSPFRQNVIWWTGERGDEIEDMIAGVGRHKETVAIPSPFGQDVFVPLTVGGKTTGALVVRGSSASREALDSVGRLVALAIERERFIEERAHLQALEESDALRTSLLRAVSHDLSTPLTSISIRTESLKRQATAQPELAEAVDAIGSETIRLRRRIDNLLAMARLEAGRLVPRPEPTPPGDLFRAIRESVPPVFDSCHVAVRVEPDCPDAFVDPSLALEIFVNLVENAHRASPPGAAIELIARRHPIEPQQVRIEVIDDGPGIAGLALADAPANLSTAETGDLPRRGLGLEIARSLTTASGGSLSIANRASGRGTVARVDLPAATLAEEVSEP
ncbi:MAG: DUF4118 domain-containing protein [Acidobacteria bacterium]|nr:DUF4118 domain-containing protein [Acidobacteriota bacterium]